MNSMEKILIVEDEPDLANLLHYKLSERGFNTWLASNGEEAIGSIKRQIPDLILLDIMMSPIDGWEVCSTIRKSSDETVRRLPIIMLTALPAAGDKIKGLRLGADDYLLKPVNMDELLLKIQNMLRKKRIEDELMERLKKGNDIPALFYHEVKNQLHVIGAYSYLIAKENITRDKREQFSEILNNTASTVSEYLEGMSIFSKIENGERKIRMERFSLNSLINKIVASYKKDAAVRGLQVETNLDNTSDIVNLNSIAMKMVLSNLIGNAIKYNKKGGAVSISTSRGDGGLVITIEDSGLGISPDDIPYIFDRFYRSRSVEGHIAGSGIGLYIVKTLVNAMDGEIEAISSLGKGSKFITTFNSTFI